MKRLLLLLLLPIAAYGQVTAPPAALSNWPTANTALTLADPATTNQVAGWDNTLKKFIWVTNGTGGGAVGTDVIWDTKGDLAVGTGANTASKLIVGSDGQVLTADSTGGGGTVGVKWATPSGGTVPSGTGFYHITTAGTLDAAALAETGTGNAVRANASTLNNVNILQAANGDIALFGRRATNTTPTGSLIKFNNIGDTKSLFDIGVTGAIAVNLDANALTGLKITRSTDTTPTGNFLDFKNAAGTSIYTVDITGTVTAGTVPAARVTGLTIGTNVQAWDTDLDTWATITPGTGVATFLATPSSANLASAVTGDTGTGALVFGTSPDFTTGITVGAVAVPTISSTSTLTNKRINPRVDSSTSASATTWAPNSDTTDVFELAGVLTVAVTTISNPSGTPVDGQKLMVRVKSDGSVHALTWSGSQWRNSTDLTLPGTTTASKTIYLGFIYNSTDTKWDLVAKLDNF